MADNLGPNGLVVSAGKCAGPIPAKNCTSCRKSMRTHNNTISATGGIPTEVCSAPPNVSASPSKH